MKSRSLANPDPKYKTGNFCLHGLGSKRQCNDCNSASKLFRSHAEGKHCFGTLTNCKDCNKTSFSRQLINDHGENRCKHFYYNSESCLICMQERTCLHDYVNGKCSLCNQSWSPCKQHVYGCVIRYGNKPDVVCLQGGLSNKCSICKLDRITECDVILPTEIILRILTLNHNRSNTNPLYGYGPIPFLSNSYRR